MSQTPARKGIRHHGPDRQQLQETGKQATSRQDLLRENFQPEVRSATAEAAKRPHQKVHETILVPKLIKLKEAKTVFFSKHFEVIGRGECF